VIPEDRELLAELSRLNREMTSLALHIMDGSATATEQQKYAERLIAAGERLRQRARKTEGMVVEGEVLGTEPFILPTLSVEPHRES
jgi:hypothetical protein